VNIRKLPILRRQLSGGTPQLASFPFSCGFAVEVPAAAFLFHEGCHFKSGSSPFQWSGSQTFSPMPSSVLCDHRSAPQNTNEPALPLISKRTIELGSQTWQQTAQGGSDWLDVVESCRQRQRVVPNLGVTPGIPGVITGIFALNRFGNNHDGSIPFTRSVHYQALTTECSKERVVQGVLSPWNSSFLILTRCLQAGFPQKFGLGF